MLRQQLLIEPRDSVSLPPTQAQSRCASERQTHGFAVIMRVPDGTTLSENSFFLGVGLLNGAPMPIFIWIATFAWVFEMAAGFAVRAQDRSELRPPAVFESIVDRDARSRALFTEASKAITSPRCVNCHPAGDHPLQGDEHRPHSPPVMRGDNGAGVPGNTCQACHTDRNFRIVGREASYQ